MQLPKTHLVQGQRQVVEVRPQKRLNCQIAIWRKIGESESVVGVGPEVSNVSLMWLLLLKGEMDV
jgi:hypothetical protein